MRAELFSSNTTPTPVQLPVWADHAYLVRSDAQPAGGVLLTFPDGQTRVLTFGAIVCVVGWRKKSVIATWVAGVPAEVVTLAVADNAAEAYKEAGH